MKISLLLSRPNAKEATSIVAAVRYKNHRLNYSVGESILPDYWDKKNQCARAIKKFPEYSELNARLEKIKSKIADCFRRYLNDNDNEIPDPRFLKNLLDAEFNKQEKHNKAPQYFLQYFQEVIDKSKDGIRVHPKTGKPLNGNTIKTYVTTMKHLTNYENGLRRRLRFEDIDLAFYDNYKGYLMKKLNLSNNTVGKHFQIIKLLLNEATETGLNKSLVFKSKRFFVIREKAENIYLTEEEIQKISEFDLSNNERLERIRDLFIIGCFTGFRYSDFSKLESVEINKDLIYKEQSKTGDDVVVPIHETVEIIINKYNGHIPKAPSNQKTNEYLKELCSKIECLQKPVTKSITKSGKIQNNVFQKWELVTTHTARRSFATNEIKRGTPVAFVMAITGHKSEKSFWKYVKLSKNDYALILKKIWEERKTRSKQIVI